MPAGSILALRTQVRQHFICRFGLVIPHITRMIAGSDAARTFPSSLLLGAAFLTAVDTLSRTLTTSEIPIGILTSFIGAPFFLYLIIREGLRGW